VWLNFWRTGAGRAARPLPRKPTGSEPGKVGLRESLTPKKGRNSPEIAGKQQAGPKQAGKKGGKGEKKGMN
jgi:hypothetical protein